MPRPGTDIRILDGGIPTGPPQDTGTMFLVAKVDRGPLGPIRIQSLAQYEATFGSRAHGPASHDTVRAFFIEGGSAVYVARLTGNGVKASGTISTALAVTAKSPGTWMNSASVTTENTTVPASAAGSIVTTAGTIATTTKITGSGTLEARLTGTLSKALDIDFGDGTGTHTFPTGTLDVTYPFSGLYAGGSRKFRAKANDTGTWVDAWAYFEGDGGALTGDKDTIGWPAASTTVPQVITWVGADGGKARRAYAVESAAGAPRQTLLDQLTPISLADPAVAVGVPIASFRFNVTVNGVLSEVSPWFENLADATGWATSNYVALSNGSAPAIPANGASAVLSGGTDDATLSADKVKAAADRFPFALGAGQLVAPDLADETLQGPLLAHADANYRNPLLDPPDTTNEAQLNAWLSAIASIPGAKFGGAFGPRVTYPGPVAPGTVRIPYSGIQAGIIARADAATGNPNDPAAGNEGISRAAIGLPAPIDDLARERLNNAGLNLAKEVNGSVRTYGYRSLVGKNDTNWRWFGGARVLCAIAHQADTISEDFVLRQIDGQGHLFNGLEVALRGLLLSYYQLGALYGKTPQDAFSIDVGPTVNTAETIANGEVHAVVKVKTSPSGEWVRIDIVKVSLGVTLAAA